MRTLLLTPFSISPPLMVARIMHKYLSSLATTLLTNIYPLKSISMFPSFLSDHTIDHGAPTCLLSDSVKVKMSKQVKDILWLHLWHGVLATWAISSTSESLRMMITGCEAHVQTNPAYCWLLCFMYVCLVLHSSYSDNIKTTPLQLALSTTNDISPLLYFTFCQPVYYHMGDMLSLQIVVNTKCVGLVSVKPLVTLWPCFKILTDNTKKIIHHSSQHPFCLWPT